MAEKFNLYLKQVEELQGMKKSGVSDENLRKFLTGTDEYFRALMRAVGGDLVKAKQVLISCMKK